MRAAVLALRQQQPARIVVAVPVASGTVRHELEAVADEVVCAATPEPFYAVGLYENFEQTSDAEVCECSHRQHTGQSHWHRQDEQERQSHGKAGAS